MGRSTWIISIILVVMGGLLAVVHWVLPGMIERSMNVVEAHAPYSIGQETLAFHDELFIADLHADTLLWKRDMLQASDRGHVDLPRLGEGNVALQFFAAVTKSPSGQNYEANTADSDNITALAVAQLWPPRTWSSLFERAMYQAEKLERDAARADGGL
ncbi:MAG: peptidase M19, partial [Pseudomonadales bacterium]|nr:peptidase M19 [Pseudomonadales bacterium]